MVDLGNGPEEVVMVDWLPNDPEDPFNWSMSRKYTMTLVAVFITALTAANATSVAPMTSRGVAYYGVSREDYVLTITLYLIAISITPLALAPASEVFGRNGIYQVTSILNALLFIPQVFTKNFNGVLAARWFQGMVSSVGNSMVGGTIADLFRADDRGTAMSTFSLMIFLGQVSVSRSEVHVLAIDVSLQAMGGIAGGWTVMDLGIKWCYAIQAFLAVLSCVLNALFLRETRADVLLSRRAKRLTKQTGIKHATASDLQEKDLKTLVVVSFVRPLQYLVTEPIVSALSAWIGFAWAVIFMSGTATLLVFDQYGFNTGQAGSMIATTGIGGILGFLTAFHQERLYAKAARKAGGRAAPEVRLYWAAVGGFMFPLSFYVFAWTGRPSIHWAVPAVMLVIFYWGVFMMYSGVFNYIADAYETYSSSAQAAQSFARNMASAIFPLFAHQLYTNLGYPKAGTLVASIGLALAAAPVLLIVYGKRLRAKSKVASALAKEQDEKQEKQ
ncbi:hypothetical protein P7C73_g3215, partial [Tremellales sp. Uapishka_1]